MRGVAHVKQAKEMKMLTKEQLVELGLTEEQVNKVVEGYADAIPRSQFNAKNDEVKALKKEVQSAQRVLYFERHLPLWSHRAFYLEGLQ